MDKDEVQDHADAGSRVEHAAKKVVGQYTSLEEKQLSAVYLHLNFEGYKPVRMQEVTEN